MNLKFSKIFLWTGFMAASCVLLPSCKLDDNRLRGSILLPQNPPPASPVEPAETPVAVTLKATPSTLSLNGAPMLAWSPGPHAVATQVQVHRASDHSISEAWTEVSPPYRGSSLSLERGEKYYFALRSVSANGSFSDTVHSSVWTALRELPCTDAKVNSMVLVDEVLYLGGTFSFLGACTGGGIFLNTENSELKAPLTRQPRVSGFVQASAADDKGGVYIGGGFSAVDGQPRKNLAYIDPQGQVSSWAPEVSGLIRSLLFYQGRLYIGGEFTMVNDLPRSRLASFDLLTGEVEEWSPSVSNTVWALTHDATKLYVGGRFGAVGAETRDRLAAFSLASGELESWNPSVTGSGGVVVRALIQDGASLYVGGRFIQINGEPRENLAAFELATGDLESWNPQVNNTVYSLTHDGSTLYAGGNFTQVAGQARNRLAAFDLSSKALDDWNPNLNNLSIWSLARNGEDLFVGGTYNSFGTSKPQLVSFSLSDKSLNDWSPSLAGGSVYSLSIVNESLFVGGSFRVFDPKIRKSLAAIDLNTGLITDWNPGTDQEVRAMTYHGDKLYIAGNFNNVGGSPRSKIASFALPEGSLTSWAPGFTSTIYSLTNDGVDLFVGGSFTSIYTGSSQTRNRLASFNMASGALTSWNPNLSGLPLALTHDGSTLYAGGYFNQVGGQARNRLAAFSLADGSLLPWNPSLTATIDINTRVLALHVADGKLLVGGGFNFVSGEERNYLAAFSTSDGSLDDWHPNLNNLVDAIAQDEQFIYVGGIFTAVGEETRGRLAAFSVTDNSLQSWNPSFPNNVGALVHDGKSLLVGGSFGSHTSSQGPFGSGLVNLLSPEQGE